MTNYNVVTRTCLYIRRKAMVTDGYCVVLGGSAGATQDLLKILGFLENQDIPPLVIVLHLRSEPTDFIHSLQRRFNYDAEIFDGFERLKKNTIFICSPLVEFTGNRAGAIAVSNNASLAEVNNIDLVMTMFARQYQEHCVAGLLSGANFDGCNGLKEIRKAGGLSLVLSPSLCEYPVMTLAALRQAQVDWVLNHQQLAELIVGLQNE